MTKPTRKGYSSASRAVAEAIKDAEIVRDFLPGPDELRRAIKHPVTIRLDADVVAWFKRFGAGYQTRINGVLRAYMDAKAKKG